MNQRYILWQYISNFALIRKSLSRNTCASPTTHSSPWLVAERVRLASRSTWPPSRRTSSKHQGQDPGEWREKPQSFVKNDHRDLDGLSYLNLRPKEYLTCTVSIHLFMSLSFCFLSLSRQNWLLGRPPRTAVQALCPEDQPHTDLRLLGIDIRWVNTSQHRY